IADPSLFPEHIPVTLAIPESIPLRELPEGNPCVFCPERARQSLSEDRQREAVQRDPGGRSWHCSWLEGALLLPSRAVPVPPRRGAQQRPTSWCSPTAPTS